MASSSKNVDTTTTGKGKKAVKVAVEEPTTQTTSEVAALQALVATLITRVEALEATVETLQSKGGSSSVVEKPKKEEKEKKPRAPTAYNNFMKEKMHELKESHPDLSNIERMSMAAKAWTESKKSTSD